MDHTSSVNDSSTSSLTQIPRPPPPTKIPSFTIDGPLPPQLLEDYSSSEESFGSSNATSRYPNSPPSSPNFPDSSPLFLATSFFQNSSSRLLVETNSSDPCRDPSGSVLFEENIVDETSSIEWDWEEYERQVPELEEEYEDVASIASEAVPGTLAQPEPEDDDAFSAQTSNPSALKSPLITAEDNIIDKTTSFPIVLHAEETKVVERIVSRDELLKELFASAPPPFTTLSSPPRAIRQTRLEERIRAQSISPSPVRPLSINHAQIQAEVLRRSTVREALFQELDRYRPQQGPRTSVIPIGPKIPVKNVDVQTRANGLRVYVHKALEASKCDACAGDLPASRIELIPCGDVICGSCWSSALAAVSVTKGASCCPSCLHSIRTFKQHVRTDIEVQAASKPQQIIPSVLKDDISGEAASPTTTVVLRIDNVAWDITPSLIKTFLPEDVLPANHPSPIHILLDRMDGKTKDYVYIEVSSIQSARLVLQTRQNRYMPAGPLTGKKRPVTITQVSHQELLEELRPKCPAELHSLLNLCQASVCTPPIVDWTGENPGVMMPNGVAHFVKSRHGPFWALMSILSKIKGKESPAYWDLFHVASGAIAALGASISRSASQSVPPPSTDFSSKLPNEDQIILDQLTKLFNKCFVTGHECEDSIVPALKDTAS